jgi:hypothetical protein
VHGVRDALRVGMTLPLQITFRNLERSEVLDSAIRTRVARLARLAPEVLRVAVVVERPHLQHRRGNVHLVTLHITLPHGHVVVGTEPDLDHRHESVRAAIGDAFRAARRAVVEWTRAHRDAGEPTAAMH